MKIKKTIFNFITLVTVLVFALIFTGQTVLASTIGAELVRVGQDASDQVIKLLSDFMQLIIGPIILAVSIIFLFVKGIKAFFAHRRGEEIDLLTPLIALIGVVIATLLLMIRIDSLV